MALKIKRRDEKEGASLKKYGVVETRIELSDSLIEPSIFEGKKNLR